MRRIRPKYTDAELAELYAKPHDHRKWKDHLLRVDTTIATVKSWLQGEEILSIADMSCGDGAIVDDLDDWINDPRGKTYKGDFAPGYYFEGPLEKTLNEIPYVDLYICSETIEHLDDPGEALKLIRGKTKYLVLTTPLDEQGDGNPEHYWSFEKADVRRLLTEAGFEPVIYQELCFFKPEYIYDYQIWLCR